MVMELRTQDLWAWLAAPNPGLPADLRQERDPAVLAACLEEVEIRQARQALLLEALCELLEAAGLVTPAQLTARLEQIDLRDGRADGRHGHSASTRCGECGRVSSGVRNRCLYCGSGDLQAWMERTG